MTAAFIVLTHQGPENAARLAARLSPHKVFVHVDSKLPIEAYTRFLHATSKLGNVFFTKRHRSAWGSWGLVAAALEGLRTALNHQDWSHIMLISGQDYPIVSATQIASFFEAHSDISFVPHWSLPTQLWGNDGGMSRILYWHTPLFGRRAFIPINRRHPAGILPIGGSMYWCLSRKSASHLIEFCESRSDVVRFYRNVWIPDELFVPTVVMNSPIADSVVNEALTYIRWSTPGSPHPDQLAITDGPELLHAGITGSKVGGFSRRKLFARKINYQRDAKLLDFLDQNT